MTKPHEMHGLPQTAELEAARPPYVRTTRQTPGTDQASSGTLLLSYEERGSNARELFHWAKTTLLEVLVFNLIVMSILLATSSPPGMIVLVGFGLSLYCAPSLLGPLRRMVTKVYIRVDGRHVHVHRSLFGIEHGLVERIAEPGTLAIMCCREEPNEVDYAVIIDAPLEDVHLVRVRDRKLAHFLIATIEHELRGG